MEIYRLAITEIRDLLNKKEVSARDVVNSVYHRIDAVEDKIKAFVTLSRDTAYRMADSSALPLSGIPIAIKDNICTKGIRTTCS